MASAPMPLSANLHNRKTPMRRVISSAMLALACLSAYAEVVYLKRSDLWAHELGKTVGEGVGHYGKWNGHMATREADHAKLEALKKKIAACDSKCPDRERLVNEANELETRLKRFDDMLCGTFSAMKQFSTPERDAAIMKLLRLESICSHLAQKSNAALDREFFAQQQKRIAAGDLNGYAEMGRHHIDDHDRPWLERNHAGCALLYRGAVLGNPDSTWALTYYCMHAQTSTEDERKGFVSLLKACSDRGANICTSYLGSLHDAVENKAKNAPFPVNENEALRLWDQAGSRGDTASATYALVLRRKMRAQESMGTPSALNNEPIERPARTPAAAVEPVSKEPAWTRPAAPRPAREAPAAQLPAQCKRLAEIVERNKQAAQEDAAHARRLEVSMKAYVRICSDR